MFDVTKQLSDLQLEHALCFRSDLESESLRSDLESESHTPNLSHIAYTAIEYEEVLDLPRNIVVDDVSSVGHETDNILSFIEDSASNDDSTSDKISYKMV